jgi:hypothetical protein
MERDRWKQIEHLFHSKRFAQAQERSRGVSYGSLDDFFTAELEAEARRNWEGNLRPFGPELPAWDDVLAELKQLLPDFFPDLIDRK